MEHCSFCGLPASEVGVLFAGEEGANICDQCIERGYMALAEERNASAKKPAAVAGLTADELLKPAEIKAFLDKYVIGQDSAK